ncbi:MAG: 50S ribosomal protein L30 [Candidatus Bathyarchaeales archaeon]
MSEKRKCLAVVRVRGVGDASIEVRETLKLLHLNRTCHATLITDRPSYIGMLQKAQHLITWGEISKENIALLLKEKGRLTGNKKLSQEYMQRIGYKSLDDLAEALFNGKIEYKNLKDIKPVFRLHPPSKGYKGKVKKTYAMGGVTGYRGEAINDLVERMV